MICLSFYFAVDCKWSPWEKHDHTYQGIRQDRSEKTECKDLKCTGDPMGQGVKTRTVLQNAMNGGKQCTGSADELCEEECPGKT